MALISRYLWRAVIVGTLMALFVLVAVDFLIDFLDELNDVGKGDYTTFKALTYSLISLPQSIYDFFPTAVLVGSMLGLGNLGAHGELVAMRAAGISVSSIAISVLKLGVVMALFVGVASEWLVPASQQYAKQYQDIARKKAVKISGKEALWARDGDWIVHANELYPGNKLGGVRVYQFKGQRLVRATAADYASYMGEYWVLEGIRHTEFTESGVVTSAAEQEQWHRLLSPEFFKRATFDPDLMSIRGLQEHIRFLEENKLDKSVHELALWTRFTTPLSCLIMLLIATPFAFGSARSGGVGQRLFIGVMLGLALFLFGQIFNNLSLVLKLPPAFGTGMPLLLFLLFGLVALRRVNA